MAQSKSNLGRECNRQSLAVIFCNIRADICSQMSDSGRGHINGEWFEC